MCLCKNVYVLEPKFTYETMIANEIMLVIHMFTAYESFVHGPNYLGNDLFVLGCYRTGLIICVRGFIWIFCHFYVICWSSLM